MIKIKNFGEIIFNGGEKFKKLREDALKSIEYLLEKIDPVNRVKEILIKENNQLKIFSEEIDLRNFNKIFLISFGKAAIKNGKRSFIKIRYL